MKQQNLQNIIFNSCIVLNCLLVFVWALQTHLEIPPFIQAFGRAHPLVLHFPIVLLLLAFIFEILIVSPQQKALINAADWILLAAALTSAIAALMGFFLSKEEGYEGTDITIHKWMGILCSLLSFIWFACRKAIRKKKVLTIITGTCISTILLITGHKGANITHGSDFLLSPVMSQATNAPTVFIEDAIIYPHVVKPILEAKCMGCHNNNKAKGELVMETEPLLLKGGKNGKLWNLASPDMGLMMQRIHLPLKDEEHMPPAGKPQLTEEEARILYLWIKGGASFTKKITELSLGDSLRIIATPFLKSNSIETYDFAAADDNVIQQLNTDYRGITPVATGSPALAVNFYGMNQFKNEHLKELEKIKNNIVTLHLSKMPVTDEDLKTIGNFSNLRNLNLSFTTIKGDGLQYLSRLQNLKQISLSGTNIGFNHLKPLMQLRQLASVKIWNTSITPKDLTHYRTNFPKINFETGFYGDTVVARLSAPIIDIDEKKKVFKHTLAIHIKVPINGAVIRYTLDGSEPDSLNTPIYKAPIVVNQSGTIKAKAFLKGWISSNVSTAGYYKNSIAIDSIQLITQPAKPYIEKAGKGKILADGLLGTTNFNTGEWIGYQDNAFETYLFFRRPATVHSVTFNTLVDMGSYIFPPAELQVWGGDNVNALRLLSKTTPMQPASNMQVYIAGHDCVFSAQTVNIIKLIAKPLKSLPAWHPGKGAKGWVFLDELFVN